MNTRNVTKEDLPKLAELISCEELAKRDDISFKHSAMAVDDTGTVVAFAIMRQRSLQDFFGGRIPNEIRRNSIKYCVRNGIGVIQYGQDFKRKIFFHFCFF